MARTHSSTPRQNRPATAGELLLSPAARERMVREAAYFRSQQRGFEPGHEEEDWTAAEAEVERAIRRRPPDEADPAAAGARAADTLDDPGMQHGGPMGPAEDDALKRAVKGHPRRDIPRVESVAPEDAPRKQ